MHEHNELNINALQFVIGFCHLPASRKIVEKTCATEVFFFVHKLISSVESRQLVAVNNVEHCGRLLIIIKRYKNMKTTNVMCQKSELVVCIAVFGLANYNELFPNAFNVRNDSGEDDL